MSNISSLGNTELCGIRHHHPVTNGRMSTIGTLLTYDRYSKPAQASIGPPKGLVIFKFGGGGGGLKCVLEK